MYIGNSGKKDYSGISADVKTYYSGMGYAIAHQKQGINFSDAKSRSIFQKGYNAGKKRLANNPSKYFKLKRKSKKKGD